MPLLILPLLIIIAEIIFYATIVIIPVVIATHYFHIVDYSCIREQIQEQKPTQCDPVYPNREHQKPEIAATEQGKPDDRLRPEVTEKRDNTQDPKVLRNSLLTGAQLIRTYRADDREISRLQEALGLAYEERDTANISQYEKSIADAIARKRLTFGMYQQELRQAQQAYTMKQLRSELPVLENELAIAGDRTALSQFASLFVSQAEGYRNSNSTDEGTISQQLIELKVK